ncbi:MAG: Na/Pi cotransporter family protein [Defluviitaleaceae bacterium]|nr:Na/Pi cotransporter family protein [Defluviitaleaceae bacterium]
METFELVQYIFLVFGGLGLFLYGMKMLIDSLEQMAGNRMRSLVERATSNRFFGIGVGAIVTVIIQSSTATSVMAVGFINAGLMSLAQAISLIIGAHIGTTFTAHVFAFRVDTAAPVFIFIGLVSYLFVKHKSIKNVGYILLSVGILFFGLSVMGDPLRVFAQTPGFQSMLVAFENPFLAILSGFVFTAIIQSSTAATGILVSLYISGVDLDFTTVAFLILGISVGTTVTALLAALAGRRESKRLALANMIYIMIGSVVFGILIYVFPGILQWFQRTWSDGARQIAMFYTFFKTALTIMFLPFVKHLAALMYKIMPKRSHSTDSIELHHIKTASHQTPAMVIAQSYDELNRMGKLVLENMMLALDAFTTGDNEKAAAVLETEASINYLNRQITSLLMELENVESVAEMRKIGTLMYIASDLERIGDHAENISEHKLHTKKGKLRVSDRAMDELTNLSRATVNIIALTMQLFDNLSEEVLESIYHLERHIDNLSKEYMENHIARLKNEKNNPRGGVIFINMITSLERCADHANNIAYYLAEIKQFKDVA